MVAVAQPSRLKRLDGEVPMSLEHRAVTDDG
jgi:hypothetical protein